MRLSDSAIDVFIFKLKSTIKYYSLDPGGAHGASETVEQAATAGRVLQGGDVEARVVVPPVAGRTRTVWRPGVTGRGGREGRSHHSRTTGRDCIEDIDWIRTWQGNWLKSFSALLQRTVLRPIGENVLRPIAENSSPQRAENSSPPY